MTREFSDELLSAYLDGELSADERATVEAELSSNSQMRQLLDELRALSSQVQSLPTYAPSGDFADRVVQAALAAKGDPASTVEPARHSESAGAPGKAVGGSVRRRARWPAVLAGVAAVAASVALLVWINGTRPIGPGENTLTTIPTLPSMADLALARLRLTIPEEGEAIVVRIRIAPGQSPEQALDAALTAAGIAQAAGSDATGAMQVAKAYRDKLLEKFGGQQPGVPNAALDESTLAAADAVFVEASWSSLEQVISALASQPQDAFDVSPLMRVAVAQATGEKVAGEGEPGSAQRIAPVVLPKQYAQRLNARLFRLEKAGGKPTEDPLPDTAAAVDAERLVRVLFLVEPITAASAP